MQRVIPDYSKADLSTLLPLQMQLTWASGLLALATDVAAGLAHLHGLQLYHGRLFPCNVIITSNPNPDPNPNPNHRPNPNPNPRPNPGPKPDPKSSPNPNPNPEQVMITSAWRAKLSEHHLDRYLAAARSRNLPEAEMNMVCLALALTLSLTLTLT